MKKLLPAGGVHMDRLDGMLSIKVVAPLGDLFQETPAFRDGPNSGDRRCLSIPAGVLLSHDLQLGFADLPIIEIHPSYRASINPLMKGSTEYLTVMSP